MAIRPGHSQTIGFPLSQDNVGVSGKVIRQAGPGIRQCETTLCRRLPVSGPQTHLNCSFLRKQQSETVRVEGPANLRRVDKGGQLLLNPPRQGPKTELVCLGKYALRLASLKAADVKPAGRVEQPAASHILRSGRSVVQRGRYFIEASKGLQTVFKWCQLARWFIGQCLPQLRRQPLDGSDEIATLQFLGQPDNVALLVLVGHVLEIPCPASGPEDVEAGVPILPPGNVGHVAVGSTVSFKPLQHWPDGHRHTVVGFKLVEQILRKLNHLHLRSMVAVAATRQHQLSLD